MWQQMGPLWMLNGSQKSPTVDARAVKHKHIPQNLAKTQAKSDLAESRIRQEGKSSTFSNPIDLQGNQPFALLAAGFFLGWVLRPGCVLCSYCFRSVFASGSSASFVFCLLQRLQLMETEC